ncbi:MAG: hypothetical protein ACE5MG_01965 [Candidatus Methylomirabilales bacterium]
MGEAVKWKRIAFAALLALVCSACATSQPAPAGRIGDLRGRIVQIEKDQGLVAVVGKPDAGKQWFKLAPLTGVEGPGISTVDGLQAGQRVYVRYLRDPSTDPPEVLSISVIKYTLSPKGSGTAGFGTGF